MAGFNTAKVYSQLQLMGKPTGPNQYRGTPVGYNWKRRLDRELKAGRSWEDIAKRTKLPTEAVKNYSLKTNPNYGISQGGLANTPVIQKATDLGIGLGKAVAESAGAGGSYIGRGIGENIAELTGANKREQQASNRNIEDAGEMVREARKMLRRKKLDKNERQFFRKMEQSGLKEMLRASGVQMKRTTQTAERTDRSRGVGAALETASFAGVPGLGKAFQAGGKAGLLKALAATTAAGSAGNAGMTLRTDSDPELKDVAKDAAVGAAFGLGAAGLGAGLGAASRKTTQKTGLNIRQTLSPDRVFRERITTPLGAKVNKAAYNASLSDNPFIRAMAATGRGVGKNFGRPEDLRAASRQFRGAVEVAKLEGLSLNDLGKSLKADSKKKVWGTLNPTQAKKLDGKAPALSDLSPREQAYRNKLDIARNEDTLGNLERGFIDEKTAANPNYLRQDYGFNYDTGKFGKLPPDNTRKLLKQFTQRRDVSDEVLKQTITDPSMLVATKRAQSRQAWAHADFGSWLDGNGYAYAQGTKGMVKLPDSPLYGAAKGKFVPKSVANEFKGYQSSNEVLNSLNTLLTKYDQLAPRRAKKQALTVFNPAVRLGNRVSNYVFASMNGLNPVEFNNAYLKVGKEIAKKGPIYKEAVRLGLTGSDITKADFARNLSNYVDDPDILKKSGNWFQKTYSGADDKARIAAYMVHRKAGYPVDEAARLTQRGFQDYRSVGWFYDNAAKLPIIGNPFVRFAGDATRLAKNALVDHPLRSIGMLSTYATFNEIMSRKAGETPQDRGTREERFGAPGLPGTRLINKAVTGTDRNISLTTQTPMGEINVARFMPFYALNDVQNEASRFLPIQDTPFTGNKDEALLGVLNPSGLQDPILGQALQVLGDKDFRGKSIRDPDNVVYDAATNTKKYPDLPNKEKKANLYRFLANQNVPLGREADAIVAAMGKKVGPIGSKDKKDIYGKERNIQQAVARSMGIKVEQFGKEQAKKQRGLNDFFDGNVERVKKFVKDNPGLAQSYYQFNNPTRTRDTNTKTSKLITPERWKIVQADQSGKLFEFLKSEAKKQNKDSGKPVDPVFNMLDKQAKAVIALRSAASGDDIEIEERLRATSGWYRKFEQAEEQYFFKNAAFFDSQKKNGDAPKTNPRVKKYMGLYEKLYPKQSKLVQKYYELKGKDPDTARDFYKTYANRLSKDFSNYRDGRLRYINAKRNIEGFDPISKKAFNNVTFGYEEDEEKVSKSLYFKLKLYDKYR